MAAVSDKLIIEAAGEQDYDIVYDLYKLLNGSEPMFGQAEYCKYISKKSNNLCLVKNAANSAIGFIAWIVWPGALSFPLDICFIQDMVVTHDNRCKGVGSFMVEHVKAWAAERDIHILHLQSDRPDAVAFYNKKGFEQRNTGLFCFMDINS